MKYFRSNRAFFATFLETFGKSEKYRQVERELDALLLLGDRMLVACDGHPEIGRAFDLATKVLEPLANSSDKESQRELAENIDLEPWLKAVVFIAQPEQYVTRQDAQRNQFNLYAVFKSLDLFPAKLDELEKKTAGKDPEEKERIVYQFVEDPVERNLIWAKEDRNRDSHDSEPLGDEIQARIRRARPITLLAALFCQKDRMRAALDMLITRPLAKGTETQGLVDSVAGEYRRHQKPFGGRHDLLEDLATRLQPEIGASHPYLLLTATEGSGKSAVASKLSEILGPQRDLIGKESASVNRNCPWLPGALLHMGKCGTNPLDITRSLLTQANALLIDPIDLKLLDPPPEREDLIPTEIRAIGELSSQSGDFSGSKHDWTRSARIEGRFESSPIAHRSNTERCRWAIEDVLRRLVAERGRATLIVDAIDEIDSRGEGLRFLPLHLPQGTTALVTGRRGTAEQAFRKYHPEIEEITLGPLNRDDIPLITQTADDSEEGAAFNNRVFEGTRGWALSVADAARRKIQTGQLDVEISASQNETVRQQAQAWEDDSLPSDDRVVLSHLQPLLAIFEPCCAISFEDLQGYLESLGIELDQPQLERCLHQVGSQLTGLETHEAKLSLRPFADYCREKRFSSRDIGRQAKKIAKWLAEDSAVNPKVVASFIGQWHSTDPEVDDRSTKLLEATTEIIEKFVGQSDKSRLGGIWSFLTDSPNKFAFLNTAADSGSPSARKVLGIALIKGTELPKDPERGRQLLERAIEQGDGNAMLYLGITLIEGTELPKDPERGRQLLERAIEQAIEQGDSIAMQWLGQTLIEGSGLPQDPERGLQLLGQAIEQGHSNAMQWLGITLIEGSGLPQDPERGLQLLEQAIEQGNSNAMQWLGITLIEGSGLPQDPERGLELLEQAIEQGNSNAMRWLGITLIEGSGLPQDPERGLELLEQAIEQGNSDAMQWLGITLIEGSGLPQDPERGLQLLEQAIEQGHGNAMALLGLTLVEGSGLPQDPERGRQLLEQAIDQGDTSAMGAVGAELLSGNLLPKDPERGLELLEQAIELGNEEAKRCLGIALTEGLLLPKDPERGLQLLQTAIAQDNINAIVASAEHSYLEGDHHTAWEVFLKAASLGSENASVARIHLADMLRRGEAPLGHKAPSFDELLADDIEKQVPFALISSALAFAAGFERDQDWRAADRIFSELPLETGAYVLDWVARLRDVDAENALILGLLERHGKAHQEGSSAQKMLEIAQKGGWDVPDWILQPKAE